jgi:hypothetical protein
VLSKGKLDDVTAIVIDSLRDDLARLRDTTILLDPNVDYGLLVSRKQALGQLPFGTTVTPNGSTISSGIYWENAWGATDLDLSAVEVSGRRVGWGQYSGYTRSDVVFSGDVTHASSGAMEFMTSKVSYEPVYALFVNIFAGNKDSSKFALVVGSKSKDKWIESPVIRETAELNSRGNVIGFVKRGKFVVYSCRLNNSAWSVGSKEAAIVAKGLADFWTVKGLFDTLDIPYSVTREAGRNYDYDLTYQGFSLDKLESVFSA